MSGWVVLESMGVDEFPHVKYSLENECRGNSVAVQRLGLSALTARALSSIPGGGTKILQVAEQLSPCTTTTEPVL